jgi:enterochelin esterase-like enzyme
MKQSTLAISLVLCLLIETAGCSIIAPQPTSTPTPTCAEDGHVERGSVKSPTLGWAIDFEYYLPPCYEEHTWASYPVIYLIPGRSGPASAWNAGGASEVANRMIRSGEIPPVIWVSPPNYTSDTQGQALLDDLIPYIDENLRTLTDRQHRAVGGASLGGAMAYRMAFQHPDLFSSAGIFGSGVVQGDEEAFSNWIAAILPEQMPRVLIDCGDEDVFMLDRAKLTAEMLEEREVSYLLNIGSGGHDFGYWGGNLEMYLRWYAEDW